MNLEYTCNVSSAQQLRRSIKRTRKKLAGKVLQFLFGRRKGLPRLHPGSVSHILLLRYDRLGDVVITTPMINALRELAPHAEIDMLLSPGNASIVRDDPRITRIHLWERSLISRLRTILVCRKQNYDLVFQLVLARTTLPGILSGWMAGSGYNVGRDAPNNRALYNYTINTDNKGHFADMTTSLILAGLDVTSDAINNFS